VIRCVSLLVKSLPALSVSPPKQRISANGVIGRYGATMTGSGLRWRGFGCRSSSRPVLAQPNRPRPLRSPSRGASRADNLFSSIRPADRDGARLRILAVTAPRHTPVGLVSVAPGSRRAVESGPVGRIANIRATPLLTLASSPSHAAWRPGCPLCVTPHPQLTPRPSPLSWLMPSLSGCRKLLAA
jgi:hypothetical protein